MMCLSLKNVQYVGIAVFLLRREFRKRDVRLLCRRTMLRMPEELMQKIYIHLRLCWIYEDTGKNTEALRERTIAVEQMEESFREKQNSGIPVEEMMLYIDCLRQLGKWKEVKEIIGEVDDEIKSQLNSEHLIRRIFEFEKKAVEMHDQTPHNIGEV